MFAVAWGVGRILESDVVIVSRDEIKGVKLDRIEYVTSHFPGRCFALDQFGPGRSGTTPGSA